MIKEFLKVKWVLGIMIITILMMFYTGLTGWRLMGSSAEKWSPEGHQNNHK